MTDTRVRITVLGRPGCKWCDKVRSLLEKEGYDYNYHDIVDEPGMSSFMFSLGIASVPQVWNHQTLIGGYERTKEWLRKREENKVCE